jgi:hypothetical protein
MMVIMALVTTFMTGPALDIINFLFKTKENTDRHNENLSEKYRVLISFGNNEKGKALLRIANSFTKKQKEISSITAMHLILSDQMHTYNLEDYERERFLPIIEESKTLKLDIGTIFKPTVDIETNIAEVANNGDYDLLLVGLGKSIFEGTLLGKVLGFTTRIINPDRLIDKFTGKEGLFENSPFDERTRQIISKTKLPIGILIDKDLQTLDKVFIPVFCSEDTFLMEYAQKLIYNSNARISILDNNDFAKNNFVINSAIEILEQKHPDNITMLTDRIMKKEFLSKQDLMLISLDSWKKLVESQSTWLANVPTVLIVRN